MPLIAASDRNPDFRETITIATGIMLFLLVIFYVTRDRIMIEHGRAGTTILRFKFIERFGHWLLAGSFILLAITGLISLFAGCYCLPTSIGLLVWGIIILINDPVKRAFEMRTAGTDKQGIDEAFGLK